MTKKKRSAKQLANDRKLGRMAKKRAAAAREKNTTKKRRKVVKRKTRRKAKRKKRRSSKKSHLWFVFKCRGNSVHYLTLRGGKPGWTLTRGDALNWKTKKYALKNARYMAGKRGMSKFDIGVADDSTSVAQIAAGCSKGKA